MVLDTYRQWRQHMCTVGCWKQSANTKFSWSCWWCHEYWPFTHWNWKHFLVRGKKYLEASSISYFLITFQCCSYKLQSVNFKNSMCNKVNTWWWRLFQICLIQIVFTISLSHLTTSSTFLRCMLRFKLQFVRHLQPKIYFNSAVAWLLAFLDLRSNSHRF